MKEREAASLGLAMALGAASMFAPVSAERPRQKPKPKAPKPIVRAKALQRKARKITRRNRK